MTKQAIGYIIILSEPTTHKASKDALRTKAGFFFTVRNAEMADWVQMKIPKTYDEQILNLQEKHGLIIADCAKAKEILKLSTTIV